MMRQFHAAKEQHPQALLFFRMGDFYELFFDDAKLAAKELGLTLTARDKAKKVPMAGVPVRAMEGYLTRLVRAGHTVAICEQVQDPREVKGLVDREVVRVVSPGTLVEDESLVGTEPLFVLALDLQPPARGKTTEGWTVGLAWADLSTGSFRCAEARLDRLGEELGRIQPAEVLLPELPDDDGSTAAAWHELRAQVAREEVPIAWRAPWTFDARNGARDLRQHLKVATLEAYGVEEMPAVLASCGGLLAFLQETQKSALPQLRELRLHRAQEHLVMDGATRRTLEVVRNLQDGGRDGTLLATIDRTGTAMGARLLREWLLEPLVDAAAIEERQQAVADLVEDAALRRELLGLLDGLGDLERLGAKLAAGRAGARDLGGLALALEVVPALRQALAVPESPGLGRLVEALDPCTASAALIRRTLVDEPPLSLGDGGLIRDGFSAEVDELRALAKGGKEYLAALQEREAARLGFAVKIGYNRVFGYYLEIGRAHSEKVPEDYIRKQTLKNAERYITPELKEYEHKVLGAEEKLKTLEARLFDELRGAVLEESTAILATAAAVAELDVVVALAALAVERRYVRPSFVDADADACGVLDIRDGRHPVVEAALLDAPFVPNDTCLGAGSFLEADGGEVEREARLAVLTGPNMSGKSTYLRQTALVVLLAQMGSFVPASAARLTLVDRIFTRLGAGDDISRGQSTFMVEMVETANILRHASPRSLLLLDEVGRGTSTFDGLAIAWAVCEHVHDRLRSRCLFATHYHQLTDLAAGLAGAVNLHVEVREFQEEIVFLHRIQEGGTDRSYGIHVAQLAGLPAPVLGRAREVLDRLERDEEGLSRRILQAKPAPPEAPETEAATPVVHQPGLFDILETDSSHLLQELLDLDLDALAPIDAWQLVARMRRAASERPK
jgi:DNA mismatch repair protein MutS